MKVLPAMLLALLGLASPFGINAQTYPNAATYPVQNSDGLGPGPDNRAFGAAVHASDGKLFAAVNNTCGELFTTIPTSAGVTPTSSTLCLMKTPREAPRPRRWLLVTPRHRAAWHRT